MPDAVLVLRGHTDCRTVFAANPDHLIPGADPRVMMTALLESAVLQNREINRQLGTPPFKARTI